MRTEQFEILRAFLNNKKKIITSQVEWVIFIATIILNMKVMAIKIKPYQSKSTLMKLNHT